MRRLLTFSRSFVRALLDSDQIEDIMVVEELSTYQVAERLAAIMRASDEGRALLAERPVVTTEAVDLDALRELPEGTLGREFVRHVDEIGLDIDLLAKPMVEGPSEEANYVLERIMQTHDLWHVLLGLGVTPHEEVLLHAFQRPQLRRPFSWIILVFGGLKHFLLEARWDILFRAVPRAWKMGAAAQSFLCVYWERHWDEPLDELRARLGVEALLAS